METTGNTKRQTNEWKKFFASCASDRGHYLDSKYPKKLNKKIAKWYQYFNIDV